MSSKAKTLARRLLRQNRKLGRSWRVIAREDFNDKINNTTLCRFAKSQGEWLPKDKNILIALGLKRERKAPRHCTDLFDMATNTLRDALTQREIMPPIDPRIIKQFVKLGWLKRAGAR